MSDAARLRTGAHAMFSCLVEGIDALGDERAEALAYGVVLEFLKDLADALIAAHQMAEAARARDAHRSN